MIFEFVLSIYYIVWRFGGVFREFSINGYYISDRINYKVISGVSFFIFNGVE